MIDYLQVIGTMAGAVAIAVIAYVSGYAKHKNEKIEAALEAQLRGEEADAWELQKSVSWWHGYTLAMLALVIIAGFIGWFTPSFIAYKWTVPEEMYPVVQFAGAFVGGMIADYFLIHPAANGLFFAKVEEPLMQSFLHPAVQVPEVTEPVRTECNPDRIETPQKTREELIAMAEALIKQAQQTE